MRSLAYILLAVAVLSGTAARAQSLTVLYTFSIGDTDPQCTLVETSVGVYYGTTADALFSITPAGTFEELFNFDGSGNSPLGDSAASGVTQASDGYLYGATFFGGNAGGGSIYISDIAGHVNVLNTDALPVVAARGGA